MSVSLSSVPIEVLVCFFFFKQKTAYEMRISDWSSDVCSSDLHLDVDRQFHAGHHQSAAHRHLGTLPADRKSVVLGKSVSVRVDLGGRRIIKKKKPRLRVRLDNPKLTELHVTDNT